MNVFSEPVDHILVRGGCCSLRSAQTFLKNNNVCVNGSRVLLRAVYADSERDDITVNGIPLPKTSHLYLYMNKPKGVVCTRQPGRHTLIYDMLPSEIRVHPLFAHLHTAGRLDADTTGLIILTTNGRFSNALASPDSHLSKTYNAVLSNDVPQAAQDEYIRRFAGGIALPTEKKSPGFTAKPASLSFSGGRCCTLTVTEGKFHQVRRMFAACGNPVEQLCRVAVGSFSLPPDLPEGECRAFSPEELRLFSDF